MATIVARTIAQRNICSQRFLLFTATRNSQIESGRSKEKSVVHSSPLGEGDLNLISGIPIEQTEERKATVYLPSRNAMQSGTHNMRRWTVSFDTESRWENPLMGWASTADPLSNTQLKFNTREAAVEYCKAYGWNFEVVEPTLPKMKPKSYGANFSWNKRTRVSTK